MNIWEFLIGASLISTLGWVANNWVRARHGYPLEEEQEEAPRKKQLDAVRAENSQLKAQITRLEERMAVMERIATDPAERTARAIEELR
jgi:cell division protein FtsB